ncbi:MAG: hypothetical protein AAFP79_14140 [Pseudomonadota bacterium]
MALSILAVSGCGNYPGEGSEELSVMDEEDWIAHFLEPQYGPVQSISGVYSASFETSAINLCDKEEACPLRRNVDGSQQLCWVDFQPEAKGTYLLKNLEDGFYWLKAKGRIAVRPGSFGHLGGYTCQIEITEIDRFEAKQWP